MSKRKLTNLKGPDCKGMNALPFWRILQTQGLPSVCAAPPWSPLTYLGRIITRCSPQLMGPRWRDSITADLPLGSDYAIMTFPGGFDVRWISFLRQLSMRSMRRTPNTDFMESGGLVFLTASYKSVLYTSKQRRLYEMTLSYIGG